MSEKKSTEVIQSSHVEFAPGGDALWAQYKLEMLTLASQTFLNEFFSAKPGVDIEPLVNDFCAAIDAAQASIDEHGRVTEVLEKLKASLE